MKHLVKIALSLLLTPYLQADVVEHTVSIQLKMHVEETPYLSGNNSIKKITPYSVSTANVIEHLCANQGKPFSSSMRLIRKTVLDENGNEVSQGYFVRDKYQTEYDVSELINWDPREPTLTKSRIHAVTKLGNISDIKLRYLSFDLDWPSLSTYPIYFSIAFDGYSTSQGRYYIPPLNKKQRVLLAKETMVGRGQGALSLKKFTSTDTYSFIEGSIRHSAPRYVRLTNSGTN